MLFINLDMFCFLKGKLKRKKGKNGLLKWGNEEKTLDHQGKVWRKTEWWILHVDWGLLLTAHLISLWLRRYWIFIYKNYAAQNVFFILYYTYHCSHKHTCSQSHMHTALRLLAMSTVTVSVQTDIDNGVLQYQSITVHVRTHTCTHTHIHTHTLLQLQCQLHVIKNCLILRCFSILYFWQDITFLVQQIQHSYAANRRAENPLQVSYRALCGCLRIIIIARMHKHTYALVHAHTQMYTPACIHVLLCTHSLTHTHTHKYTHLQVACLHKHTFVWSVLNPLS